MGEKGVGKLSRETPPPREGEPMGASETGRNILSSADSLHLSSQVCSKLISTIEVRVSLK